MPIYSHSRLSETCPQQYKFQYVDKVEVPEEEAIQLFLGSRVHEALEHLYRDLIRGRVRTLDRILGFYRQQWERQWSARVRFPNPDDRPEAYRIAGEAYLSRPRPWASARGWSRARGERWKLWIKFGTHIAHF